MGASDIQQPVIVFLSVSATSEEGRDFDHDCDLWNTKKNSTTQNQPKA
jgi:hypothetical protein